MSMFQMRGGARMRWCLLVLVSFIASASVYGDDREDFKRFKRNVRDRAIRNRCQPQEDFVKRHFDRSDWMGSSADRLSSIRLVDLKLIGSHNAASYGISEPFDEYSICQNARISTQLMAGARYIDIRAGVYEHAEPKVRTGHGPHHGEDVTEVLEEIANFSREHGREFVMVSVKDASWAMLRPGDKAELIRTVERIFDGLAITSRDEWFDPATTTLGQVWANNKSVLVLYGDSLLRSVAWNGSVVNVTLEEATSRGIYPRDPILYDPWANTESIDLLFRRLDEFYERRPRPRNKFYIAQFVLTANLLFTDGIDELTRQLQRSDRIGGWLREHPDYNVVYLDFLVGVTPQERPMATALLDYVIGWGNQSVAGGA